jgi:hypothetical protein
MARYARVTTLPGMEIHEPVVVELLDRDDALTTLYTAEAAATFVACGPEVEQWWRYDGATFTPPPPDAPATAAAVPTVADLLRQVEAIQAQLAALQAKG